MLMFCSLAASMEDTCQRLSCGDQGWECRNLRVCDSSATCNIAVPTCIYKDTSRYRIPNICPMGGNPVVDTSGKEVTCGGVKDCPLGFICKGGVCCPGAMADVALPTCQSLVKPNYNLPLFSTLEVCANQCTRDGDCAEEQICCFRTCGSKCVKIDSKAQAKTAPNIVTASSLSSSSSSPSSPPDASPSSISAPLPISLNSYGENNEGVPQKQGAGVYKPDLDEDRPPPPNQLVPQFTQSQDGGVQDSYASEDFSSDIFGLTQEEEVDVTEPATPVGEEETTKTTINVVAVAPIIKPKDNNFRKGPIPAKSIQVNAPSVSNTQVNMQTNPADDYPQKSGVCPRQPSVVICGQRPCDRDSVCPGPTKCCPTHCGQVCVTPQASAAGGLGGRLGRLQGTLFRDIGAYKQPTNSATLRGRREDFTDPTSPGVFGRTLRDYGVDFASQNARSGRAPIRGPSFPNFQNVGEPEEGRFYKPGEGLLLEYGFRSPGVGAGLSPARSATAMGSREEQQTPTSAVAAAARNSSQRGNFQVQDNTRSLDTAEVTSAVPSSLGASDLNRGSADDSYKMTAATEADGRGQSNSNDIIIKAVSTAFGLNSPPWPSNNARRGVSKTRPSGGLLGGYALSFPDSPSSSSGYSSGTGIDIDSNVANIGFAPRVSSRSPFGGFSGYGPNGFFDTSSRSSGRSGLDGYDTVDAGAFGNINKADYEKLGLDTVTNSFNKTTESESRKSRIVDIIDSPK
ncbi:hypothetical protein PoB_007137200 [Plakobranchus ocellatus]|uniref:WAP domain-containing protein n=1 Tax=Plakobranchus ocellatus TaxID=259542 RepID=A0AAV4DKQ7_9GAST|nr:hypothetical protein PoB_007137200 [Plakobranchus ocellatus]